MDFGCLDVCRSHYLINATRYSSKDPLVSGLTHTVNGRPINLRHEVNKTIWFKIKGLHLVLKVKAY